LKPETNIDQETQDVTCAAEVGEATQSKNYEGQRFDEDAQNWKDERALECDHGN
jgi:hypothetical protein